jgi:flagellar motor switch protein FliN/FliY
MNTTSFPEDDDDPWGAAMAEQAQAETRVAPVADPAPVATHADHHVTAHAGFTQPADRDGVHNDIGFILDIPVQLTVELGRTKIAIKNLLQLAQGSVVELEGLAGEPMDVLINGCQIAQGEVVVVNDKFGIRLTDIINPAERIRGIKR